MHIIVEWFSWYRQGSLDRPCREYCASFKHVLEDHTWPGPGSTIPTSGVPLHHLRPSARLFVVLCLVGKRLGARRFYNTIEPWACSLHPTHPCSPRSVVFCDPGTVFYHFGYQAKPNIRSIVTGPWTMVTAPRLPGANCDSTIHCNNLRIPRLPAEGGLCSQGDHWMYHGSSCLRARAPR